MAKHRKLCKNKLYIHVHVHVESHEHVAYIDIVYVDMWRCCGGVVATYVVATLWQCCGDAVAMLWCGAVGDKSSIFISDLSNHLFITYSL